MIIYLIISMPLSYDESLSPAGRVIIVTKARRSRINKL